MTEVQRAAMLAAVLVACGAPPAQLAEVEIGLAAPVPESVASISVFVIDTERTRVVTSATVARTRTSLLLGVPAEVPLDFRVVAWTNKPGPSPLPAMPAFFGSSLRTIPLGRERQLVAITVYRAGVLTIGAEWPEPTEEPERQRLSVAVTPSGRKGRPFEIEIPDEPAPRWRRTVVLRTGRYAASVLPADRDDDPIPWTLLGAEGLYVGPEQESVTILEIGAVQPPPLPEAPHSVGARLADGQPIPRHLTIGDAPAVIEVGALDAVGQAAEEPGAQLSWSVTATPTDVFAGTGHGTAEGLPALLPALVAERPGRARLRVRAELEDGRTLEREERFNVLPPGQQPGPPVRVRLDLAAPERIAVGTELAIELVDAFGLFARGSTATVDLGGSDPWLFMANGPTARLSPEDGGHLSRRVARPSGPRDVPVVMRATVTSTAIGRTLTSTLTLPILAIP